MPTRRYALTAGILYFVTHITSVVAADLYLPTLADPMAAAGTQDAAVHVGAMLEVVLAAAIIGTSVALYPVLKRLAPGMALAYVALRLLEATVVLTGVVAILGVLGAGEFAPVFASLNAMAFTVGPGLICPINTVVIAIVLWRTGLVARWIPALGLVGAPVVFASNVAIMTGVYEQTHPLALVAAVPIFAWEISLAVTLVARGFRPLPASAEFDVVGDRGALTAAVDEVGAIDGDLAGVLAQRGEDRVGVVAER
ncbi:MAG: DUF4386 domain-containing protein [Propionibacterium sp.]|nr:DUF4386 domain-containing protein [Propionibacterium sp.]